VIEIRQDQTGDVAEAESAEAAIVAARTLCEDAAPYVTDPLTATITLEDDCFVFVVTWRFLQEGRS
jgi:hypothetical protein